MNVVVVICFAGAVLAAIESLVVVESLSLGTNCPQFCVCDLESNLLSIQCFQPQANNYFNMPDLAFDPDLEYTKSVVIKNSFLRTFPNYICQYSKNLLHMDLSSNQIVEKLTSTNFNCLQDLITLNLSRNELKYLDEDTFNRLNALVVLDMSNNRIEVISPFLFYKKLPQLEYLYLQNNTIVELDPWYFFFQRIKSVDLSFNKISKLTNYIGWRSSIWNDSSVLKRAEIIDLRYNIISKFDDAILHTYYLCTPSELSYFLNFIYRLRIDANPIECTCDSYHLLQFYSTLTLLNLSDLSLGSLSKATCASPNKYAGRSVFDFENTNMCFGAAALAPLGNCISFTMYTVGTTKPGPVRGLANVSGTDLFELAGGNSSNVPDQLTSAQIAGIIIGILLFILLSLLLLYALFRIEIHSLVFYYVPMFYTICPCKRYDESNKIYDVFVAHNTHSNEWIEDSLIPYFRLEKPVNKFFLQYSQKNTSSEVISPYLKKVMSNSSCILLVVSEAFLTHEWSNVEFRNHVRHLVSSNEARLICVQMHGLLDEEIDDYIRSCLQLPQLVTLESEEILFWFKLTYYLHTNRLRKEKEAAYANAKANANANNNFKYSLPSLPDNVMRSKRKVYDQHQQQQQENSGGEKLKTNQETAFNDWTGGSCFPSFCSSSIFDDCNLNSSSACHVEKCLEEKFKFNSDKNRVEAPLVHVLNSCSSDSDRKKNASNQTSKIKVFHLSSSKPKTSIKIVKRLDLNSGGGGRRIEDAFLGAGAATDSQLSYESQTRKAFRLKGLNLLNLKRFFCQHRGQHPSAAVHSAAADESIIPVVDASKCKAVTNLSTTTTNDIYFNYRSSDLKDKNNDEEEPASIFSITKSMQMSTSSPVNVPNRNIRKKKTTTAIIEHQQQKQEKRSSPTSSKRRVTIQVDNNSEEQQQRSNSRTSNNHVVAVDFYKSLQRPTQNIFSDDDDFAHK